MRKKRVANRRERESEREGEGERESANIPESLSQTK